MVKISDILSGKKEEDTPQPKAELEAEKLEKQRKELEQEAQQQDYGDEGGWNQPMPEMPPPPPPQPQQAPPQQQYVPQPKTFSLTVVVEGGIKLPVSFTCLEQDLPAILADIDRRISEGEMIIIERFRIPASRILFIDMG